MPRNHDKQLALLDALEELKRCRQERDDALATVEHLQQQLADSQALSRIGTWRRVLDTDDLFWSDQAYKIHGLDKKTPLTRETVVSLVHENDRERVQKEFDAAIAERRSFRVIYRIRRPDGSVRVLHVDNMVTPDSSKGSGIIYGAIHDITEAPLPGNPLQKRDPELPADSLIIDPAGIIVRASGRFAGRVRRLEAGSSVFQLFAEGHSHDDLAHAMDAVEAEPHTRVVELTRFRRESEGRQPFELRPWSPFGDWWGFVLSEPTESGAVSSEDGQSDYFASSDSPHVTGAWERDLDTGTVLWSGALYRIMEHDPAAPPLSREQFLSLILPEDRDRVRMAADVFDETKIPMDCTFRIRTPSGKLKTIRTQAEYFDRTHAESHVMGTVTDMSDTSDLERAVRRADMREQQLRSALSDSRQQLLTASLRLQTAQEQERFRIATELHDEAGGLLTALNLTLIQLDSGTQSEPLERARQLLDQLTEQIRHSTRKLRPAVLDRFGLTDAIRQLANDMASLASWNLELDLPTADLHLEDDLTDVLYGTAREALLNAAKHADADTVSLLLRNPSDGYFLEIEDDGVGMRNTRERTSPTGLGLTAMRDRVESFGGTIKVTSGQDGGTKVAVFIPCSPQ